MKLFLQSVLIVRGIMKNIHYDALVSYKRLKFGMF